MWGRRLQRDNFLFEMTLTNELQTAIRAVIKACSVCTTIRASHACEDAISKKDRSPVTIADFGSQAVIIRELLEDFPGADIVAEEDSTQMQTLHGTPLGGDMVQAVAEVMPGADWATISSLVSKGNFEGSATGRFWTIDPIDGTKGFLRNEQYAVALVVSCEYACHEGGNHDFLRVQCIEHSGC